MARKKLSLRTLKFLLDHPLSSRNKLKAFLRFVSWQLRSRLIGKPVAYSFVNHSQLLVYPGMTGATGNIYAGLHEFYDMGFVLHALKGEDIFVDIGANIGSYTVLAGSAIGSNCVSIEPVPSTFSHLLENVSLNNIKRKVECLNIGLGKDSGTLRFSADEDTKNHVVADSENCKNYIEIEVKRLDDVMGDRTPTVIKIDVEGWETHVIAGAQSILSKEKPLAILMEFGLGERYGFNEQKLYQEILDFGFERVSYSPFERTLALSDETGLLGGNILFMKGIEYFQDRVKSAPKFKALGVSI